MRERLHSATDVNWLEKVFWEGFLLGAACDPKLSSGHIFCQNDPHLSGTMQWSLLLWGLSTECTVIEQGKVTPCNTMLYNVTPCNAMQRKVLRLEVWELREGMGEWGGCTVQAGSWKSAHWLHTAQVPGNLDTAHCKSWHLSQLYCSTQTSPTYHLVISRNNEHNHE